jgi:hypothetical protein
MPTIEERINQLSGDDAEKLAHQLYEFAIQNTEGRGAEILETVALLAMTRADRARAGHQLTPAQREQVQIPSVTAYRAAEQQVAEEELVNRIYTQRRRLARAAGVPVDRLRERALYEIRSELADIARAYQTTPEVIDRVLSAKFGSTWGKPCEGCP